MAVVMRQFAFDEQTIRELKVVMERLRNDSIPPEAKMPDMAVALEAMREWLDMVVGESPPTELAN